MIPIKRYERNMQMLSEEENLSLRNFKVCVIGCGGLGGNTIEQLARLGIGSITAVDGDIFDESNLNRQLLSTESNIGEYKANEALKRVNLINSDVELIAIEERLNSENAKQILSGHDLIMDATDNVTTRLLMKEYSDKLDIPIVHGAIAAWYGQVSVIYPGDNTFDRIYPDKMDRGIEVKLGNPSFTPAIVAGIQVAEALKVLLKKGEVLRDKLLYINLLDHEYTIVEI